MNREDNRRRFELLRERHFLNTQTAAEHDELDALQTRLEADLDSHYRELIWELDERIAQLEARVEGQACPA